MKIVCSGNLKIGDGCWFNGNLGIICYNKVTFGKDCRISWESLFMDTDFHAVYKLDSSDKQINPDCPISIGNHVWIGCRTTILKGTKIPDNSVIAAGSIVTAQLSKESSVYISNRVLREKIYWK